MQRAVSEVAQVRASRAKAIMMMLTWMVSNGELSTGMRWVICGSICEMWLTSRKKPDNRKPKVSMTGNFLLAAKASSMTAQARNSMVS